MSGRMYVAVGMEDEVGGQRSGRHRAISHNTGMQYMTHTSGSFASGDCAYAKAYTHKTRNDSPRIGSGPVEAPDTVHNTQPHRVWQKG